MTNNETLKRRRDAAVPRGLGTSHPGVFAERAKNAEIWDVDGQRFIDFASGIAVTNLGHAHRKLLPLQFSRHNNLVMCVFRLLLTRLMLLWLNV